MQKVTSNGSSTQHPTEYTSLLSKPFNNEPCSDPKRSEEPFSRALILTEFWLLLKHSIPVILAYTLQNSLQTVSVLIIGRSSPENLAASAFSQMFAMVTAWMIGLGGTTAMDTLASSSFTGSSNKHDLGILLQRGFIVLGLFYIPVAFLWACSEPIFLFLGQDPQLSSDSARFLTCLIPGGLGYIYFEVMKKYLQAQGIMRAGTYVLLITSPLSAALNYIFCYKFEIGLLGAPLATGLCYWLSFALLVLYARFISGSECWGGWSREAFQNLRTFARLALMGIIHVGTEWWAFEIVALAAGRLGTISLAAQSVIMTADQVLNTIPFGIGVATSGRVGNLLGKRDDTGAARAAHTSALLSVAFGGIVLVVLMGTREHFAKIFNDDASVVDLTAEVLPYVALFQIADGLNGSCGGVYEEWDDSMWVLWSIWLVITVGLWVGQCIALYLVGALEWVIVARSQWENEVHKAFQRMDVHGILEDGVEEE
ncbi:Multi antimicrobial extrusion protein [Penicillium coprophilum]|uniref:Multi antimicrobial extrusion protein n=1 Tax=Penicillium coprophilum TaxID=36646 RepID=UPI0023A3523B|nr:Multi antimicrobial extrusion protein [Penicillium coprophilum]KAJ5177414.1 Multi antimicrobial extrusion protein [Penicillium coprophilum]